MKHLLGHVGVSSISMRSSLGVDRGEGNVGVGEVGVDMGEGQLGEEGLGEGLVDKPIEGMRASENSVASINNTG